MDTLQIKESFLSEGSLILINEEHPLKRDMSRASFVPPFLDFPQIRMEVRAAACLSRLFDACGRPADIIPVSGLRTGEEQAALRRDTEASRGADFADRYVARAGCSEHESGLAVDLARNSEEIDMICPDFPKGGSFDLFRALSARYGFVQRYTAEKTHITGIGCEPWHFRYVGYPHSDLMNQMNLCLEEYIAYLRRFTRKKPLILLREGKRIRIFCEKPGAAVSLEGGEVAEISGTNAGECVVTVWK